MDSKKVCAYKQNKYFVYIFLFIVDYKIEDFKLQKEEVAEVKNVKIEEIELAKKE